MRSGYTLIELLVVIAIVMIVLTLVFGALGATKLTGVRYHYSDGERAGVVYKISKKGFVFKTWEGELNVAGIGTDSNGVVVPARWEFSVVNDGIAKQIQEAANSGKRVVLKYNEYWNQPRWKGDTGYEITEVVYPEITGPEKK